jgi:gliding motility-associated-like protein
MATNLRWLSCFLPVLICANLQAQYTSLRDTSLTVSSTLLFTDSGGKNNAYQANEKHQMTFCPDAKMGTQVLMNFPALDLAAGSRLCFFDGTDTLATRLLCVDAAMAVQGFNVQSSITNKTGCITVFFSAGAKTAQGWLATVRSVSPCQSIQVAIDSILPAIKLGTQVITLCPGGVASFKAHGIYPQNNTAYQQSDSSSTFTWDFGDGSIVSGKSVSHVYAKSGGYQVNVTLSDARGCVNSNNFQQKVIVATSPNYQSGFAERAAICLGDTLMLQYADPALKPPSTLPDPLVATARTGFFQNQKKRDRTQFLPDGNGGQVQSSINFNEFNVNQFLTNPNDLQINIVAEHSRLQDLVFTLICPSEQSVVLQSYVSTTGTAIKLGVPVTNDNNLARPGQGFEYSWQNNATNNTWESFVGAFSPTTLPAGAYQPLEPMNQLLGCPLNGNWTLKVTDKNAGENGFLFSWGLKINPSLFPQLSFKNGLSSINWRLHPSILFQNTNTINVSPKDAGRASYVLQVTDSLGCKFDTAVSFKVLPVTNPKCKGCTLQYSELRDTSVCQAESLVANLKYQGRLDTVLKFAAFPQYRIGNANHPPSNPYLAILPVSSVAQDSIGNPIQQIESVCMDIATDWNADLRIYLVAPSGQILELSTNNGGGSDNYANTCFTSTANTPIQNGTGPFSGTYRPEGDWNVLKGAKINGDWALLVSDSFDITKFGEIKSWSITFRSKNSVKYSWSPSADLSCSNCPNPLIRPLKTTSYSVVATDLYGCVHKDSLLITVLDTLPAPRVRCLSSTKSSITFGWNSSAAKKYRIKFIINGRDSIVPIALPDTVITLRNLQEKQSVSIEIQPFVSDTSYKCRVGIGRATCVSTTCNLKLLLGKVTNISCPGQKDGSVIFTQTGSGSVRTALLGPRGLINSPYNRLEIGDYKLWITDTLGCSDTARFQVKAPDSLLVSLRIDQALSCNGDANGAISPIISGGSMNFSYMWNTGAATASLNSLKSGRYAVTVTDSKGCVGERSIILPEPDTLKVGLNIKDVSCNGGSDGRVTTTVSGGNGNYGYRWTNSSNQSSIANLAPGLYCVTVSDQKGCQKQICATITNPAALRLDSFKVKAVSCFGKRNGQAIVFAAGGRGKYTYIWNDSLAQNGQTATLLRAGTVSVTVRDSNNCLIGGSISIPQPAVLIAGIQPIVVKCKGGNDGQLLAKPTGGTRPYFYIWDNPTIGDSLLSNLSAGDYRLTVTDINGCIANTRTTLTEPATLLTLATSQTVQGCFGTKKNQGQVMATGGVNTKYNYLWNTGQITAAISQADSLLYTVTVTDAGGCVKSAGLKLKDLPDMEPNTIVSLPSCFGATNGAIGINLILGRPNADLTKYTFVWNTGQTGGLIRGLVGDSTYTVTITDPIGCVSVKSRLVKQPKKVTLKFAVENTKCNGSKDGKATVASVDADTRIFTYKWDVAAGNVTTPAVSNLAAGKYAVTVTDEFNCFGVGTAEVQQPGAIQVTFTNTNNKCFADTTGQLQVKAVGGTPNYTFLWSNGATKASLQGLAAGTYSVTATDANKCTAQASTNILQPPALQTNVQVTSVTCFQGRDGRITFNPSGGKGPYLYSLNSKDFRSTSSFIGLKKDAYPVYIKDANGCTFIENVKVTEPPEFKLTSSNNSYTIRLGDTLKLKVSPIDPQGMVKYTWDAAYPGTLSCTNCPTPTVNTQNQISYKVLGVDDKGCEASFKIDVFLNKERIVAVPTGFTPNRDNENDLLLVHGQKGTKVLKFQVFDRWGELVFQDANFEVNDYTRGWDGSFKEQPMTPGIFIWFLEVEYLDGFKEIKRGQTTLIR